MRLREAIDILRSLGTLPSLVSGLSRELERMREQQETDDFVANDRGAKQQIAARYYGSCCPERS
jgi:hypothetical protein